MQYSLYPLSVLPRWQRFPSKRLRLPACLRNRISDKVKTMTYNHDHKVGEGRGGGGEWAGKGGNGPECTFIHHLATILGPDC